MVCAQQLLLPPPDVVNKRRSIFCSGESRVTRIRQGADGLQLVLSLGNTKMSLPQLSHSATMLLFQGLDKLTKVHTRGIILLCCVAVETIILGPWARRVVAEGRFRQLGEDELKTYERWRHVQNLE